MTDKNIDTMGAVAEALAELAKAMAELLKSQKHECHCHCHQVYTYTYTQAPQITYTPSWVSSGSSGVSHC